MYILIKQNAPNEAQIKNIKNNITQNFKNNNVLDCIFNVETLRNVRNRAELYRYWAIACETQNPKYRAVVDRVFDELYPRE